MQYKFKFLIFYTLLFLVFSCNNDNVGTISKNGMVSSAHPLASKVGVDILKSGGNAFDAAVAVHFALSVVYPNAGNIGGGGFAIYRLENGEIGSLDFREKAPINSTRDMYLKIDKDGKLEVDDDKSKLGHLAVGVPGAVDGMVKIHERFGLLKWDELINPSIELAKKGFKIKRFCCRSKLM